LGISKESKRNKSHKKSSGITKVRKGGYEKGKRKERKGRKRREGACASQRGKDLQGAQTVGLIM
jgi:hypothetical protein